MQNPIKARLGFALTTTALILSACGGGSSPEPQDPCQLPSRTGEQAGVICGTVTGTTATAVKPLEQIVQGAEFEAPVRQSGQFEMVCDYSAGVVVGGEKVE